MNTIRWATNQTFANTEDGGMVEVVIPGNLIIAAGVTVTTQYRCKGLHIQVMGNCYHYGTIDMTARGPNLTGQSVGLEFYSDRNEVTYNNHGVLTWLPACRKIPATDGTAVRTYGPGSKLYYDGLDGGAATNGGCGAGGAGSMLSDSDGQYGDYSLVGTSFSGGPASGAWSWLGISIPPVPPAGAGGYDIYGDGAGNGVQTNLQYAEIGTGGLIVLSVLGFLYIASTGVIKSNGKKGGYANDGVPHTLAGGGSGGGSINLLYGSLTNNGTINADGGARQTTSAGGPVSYGGAGGAGSVRANSLKVT